jgi:NADH-quinone oxidoreductase subunit N
VNSPLLWILLPLLVSSLLFLFRQSEKWTALAAAVFSLFLAWAAWKVQLGTPLELGPLTIKIEESLALFGRRFVLQNSDRPTLALIYLAASFWFGGAFPARAGKMFAPFGLAVVALMTATLAVEPFLYAALFIQIAALLCIPILAAPGKAAQRGVLRFLTFQTLGAPFILFSGWLLAGAGVSPGDLPQVARASILLAIGFFFLLAVFPFHTWIPILSEESHPYAAAFVFFMLPGIASLFGISFLERYAWLRNADMVYSLLLVAGAIMIVTGGVWAAFQRHLGRMLGFAVIVDIGLSLLVIGSGPKELTGPFLGGASSSPTMILFFSLFLYRCLALGSWALALASIKELSQDLRFRAVYGLGRKMPLAASAAILAHLSLAGFPLLAGFPVRLALIERLSTAAPLIVFAVLLGALGLLSGAVRSMAVLVMGEKDEEWSITERPWQRILLSISIVMLVLSGVLPQIIR